MFTIWTEGMFHTFGQPKCLYQTNAEGMSEFSDPVSLSGSKVPSFGREEYGRAEERWKGTV